MSVAYYSLLGLTPQASIAEIKKAYRAKAMQLHPDKNPSPEAQALFIELTEAYEYLLAEKSGRFKQYISPFTQAEQAAHARREAAKQKAREYAQMRYEAFEQSQAAKTLNSLNIFLNHFMFLFVMCLLIGLPIVVSYFYPIDGTITAIIFVALVAWPTFQFTKHLFNPMLLWEALNDFVETLTFRMIVLSILNIYLYIKIVMNTMVATQFTLLLFGVIIFGLYSYLLKAKKETPRIFYSFSIAPLCVNLIFAINFYGSSKPKIETYPFWNEHTTIKGGRSVKTTTIHLEGDVYQEYHGIRSFGSLREMSNCNTIIYQFEDGLLGMRVMKHYAFTYE